MAKERIKKPASTFVPVQKKASVSAPPGMMGQHQETSVSSGQEQTLSNKPATDDDWLMKSGLFSGQHLLQRLATPVSSESELATGSGQVEQSEEEKVQGSETVIPHSLLPTPHSLPLQAKLTIGAPGDKYEQEADRVAADVVSRINTPQSQAVQREEMAGEEEELQMKPVSGTIQREEMPGEEEELQMKPVSATIQREEMPVEEDELQMKPMVQRVQDGGGMAASADLEGAIQGARGSGQPLEESVREPMEREFGADFSGVRVHTDAQSDQLNQSIQAKAFTTGSDIFFRQGAYEPSSRGGQELLAHELTHVVQQKAGSENRPAEKFTNQSVNLQTSTNIIQACWETNASIDVYEDADGVSRQVILEERTKVKILVAKDNQERVKIKVQSGKWVNYEGWVYRGQLVKTNKLEEPIPEQEDSLNDDLRDEDDQNDKKRDVLRDEDYQNARKRKAEDNPQDLRDQPQKQRKQVEFDEQEVSGQLEWSEEGKRLQVRKQWFPVLNSDKIHDPSKGEVLTVKYRHVKLPKNMDAGLRDQIRRGGLGGVLVTKVDGTEVEKDIPVEREEFIRSQLDEAERLHTEKEGEKKEEKRRYEPKKLSPEVMKYVVQWRVEEKKELKGMGSYARDVSVIRSANE